MQKQRFEIQLDFTIECLNLNYYYKRNQQLRLHPDERHLSLIVANLIWFDFLEVGQSFSLSVRTQTYLRKKLMMEKIKIKTSLVFNDYQRPIFSIICLEFARLFWLTQRKNCSSDEKIFANLRLTVVIR